MVATFGQTVYAYTNRLICRPKETCKVSVTDEQGGEHMALIGYALIAVIVFALDLLIKNYIEHTRAEGETGSACGGLIVVHRYHNKGAFLNLGEKKQKLMTIVSLFLTLFLTVVFLTTFTYRGRKTLKTGLALLLGGAYSNTYDRLVRKYVVDYVSFPVKNKKIARVVFNLSDFCIMIGALMMTLGQKPGK